MKLSILTAAYNRGELLKNLYNSILNNIFDGINIEWLIMDDGSTDNTDQIAQSLEKTNNLEIKYYSQKNQGKMTAINNLMEYITGDLVLECDSDDYFAEGAFKTIYSEYQENKKNDNIYAFVFLKMDQNNEISGKELINHQITTMFDLYYKYSNNGECGEKALVFITEKRKKYKYELQGKERFVTEASMFYKMDEKYNILCVNFPLIIFEYQKDGYTKNIMKIFKENPLGYFKYFEYLLSRDLTEIKFKNKLYFMKHYILFSYLTKQHINYRIVKNLKDRIILAIFYIPGIVVSWLKFKK